MKKYIASFTLLFIIPMGLAYSMVLDYTKLSSLKDKNAKIAIQWAVNAQEIQEENKAIINGLALNSKSLQVLDQSGKIKMDAPKKSEYFRILVWSKGKEEPDLLTNWVKIVHTKNYVINQDQLIPAVLMAGIGC